MQKYLAICKVVIDGEVSRDYKVRVQAPDTYEAMRRVERSFDEHEDLVNTHFKEILSIEEYT